MFLLHSNKHRLYNLYVHYYPLSIIHFTHLFQKTSLQKTSPFFQIPESSIFLSSPSIASHQPTTGIQSPAVAALPGIQDRPPRYSGILDMVFRIDLPGILVFWIYLFFFRVIGHVGLFLIV